MGAMKDPLLFSLKEFLNSRLIPNAPLLIGYSGGPDSKALLHLLLESRRFFAFELHAAHVDHGWREESAAEAQKIQEEMQQLGVNFHLQSISRKEFAPGNMEEQGRDFRLDFFSRIYHQIGAQALLLGHQADDQAETVLKRVFEGASLFSLGGLALESSLLGMRVWRPLLFVEKKEILQWLSSRNLTYFLDATNKDTRFLRGKMREEMVPFLTASFGKQVSANLCRLGEESKEVKEYFHKVNQPILEGKDGFRLDLNPYLPMPLIQLKYLIKGWLEQERLTISRQILEGMAAALNDRAVNKKFHTKDGDFLVHNGCFYLIK